jgi:hypothetical protein
LAALAGASSVDAVRFDLEIVLGLADSHLRPPRQQLIHQALEVGREVLQDDERHTRVGGKRREQPLERLEAAGRGADGDLEVGLYVGRSARGS